MDKITKEQLLEAIEMLNKIDQEIKEEYEAKCKKIMVVVNTDAQEKMIKENFPFLRVANAKGLLELENDKCYIMPYEEVEPIKFIY